MSTAAKVPVEERIADFLAQRRIAVSGVSRTRDDAANLLYRKFKEEGYEVFAVNPKAESFDGDPCYPSLQAIPGGVDGVVIVNKPEVAAQVVRDAAAAGVRRVWMHHGLPFLPSSVSDEGVAYAQEHGIDVIAGACPNMYCAPDFAHKCMKWMLKVTGSMPE